MNNSYPSSSKGHFCPLTDLLVTPALWTPPSFSSLGSVTQHSPTFFLSPWLVLLLFSLWFSSCHLILSLVHSHSLFLSLSLSPHFHPCIWIYLSSKFYLHPGIVSMSYRYTLNCLLKISNWIFNKDSNLV